VLLLTLITLAEMSGELAFARFLQWQKIAGRTQEFHYRSTAIEAACIEADHVIQKSSGNADALLEVTVNSLWQATDRKLEPALRIRLSQQAGASAMKAAQTAPTDYECWLWLGRAQLVLGNRELARLCLGRAQDIAPPDMKIEQMGPPLHRERE